MRWPFGHMPVPENPEPPQGVILHWRGRAIGCSVLREPGADEHGSAAWIAVPSEPVNVAPSDAIRLTATVLPARSILLLDFTLDLSEAAGTS